MNLDDLYKLAGIQQSNTPAIEPVEVEQQVAEQPIDGREDMKAMIALITPQQLNQLVGDAPVAEEMPGEATTEPNPEAYKGPLGSPADLSLRRYLGANGQPVSVDETNVYEDHKVEDITEAWQAYKVDEGEMPAGLKAYHDKKKKKSGDKEETDESIEEAMVDGEINKDSVKMSALELLVDIAKTSKQYKGEITKDQVHYLGSLVQDFDVAGIETEKYSEIEKLFRTMADTEKADMTMIQPAYAQAKSLDEDATAESALNELKKLAGLGSYDPGAGHQGPGGYVDREHRALQGDNQTPRDLDKIKPKDDGRFPGDEPEIIKFPRGVEIKYPKPKFPMPGTDDIGRGIIDNDEIKRRIDRIKGKDDIRQYQRQYQFGKLK